MLARISTVLAANCAIVIMPAGTNDVVANTANATVLSNLQTMYADFVAAGTIVIRPSIIPRPGGTGGANGFTAPQAANAQVINTADAAYIAANPTNLFFVNLNPWMTSNDANWTILSDMLETTGATPGVHPNNNGASVMATPITNLVNAFISRWPAIASPLVDLFNATTNPTGNLLPNPTLNGTGGTASNGATGTVANSTTVSAASAGTAGVAASKTTDASGNTYQVVTLSGTYSGSNAFADIIMSSSLSASINTGDIVQGSATLNFGANPNISGVNVFLSTTESGTSYYQQGALPEQDYDLPNGYGAGLVTITTPKRVLTATPSAVSLTIRIYFQNEASTSAISGVVQTSYMSVRKSYN